MAWVWWITAGLLLGGLVLLGLVGTAVLGRLEPLRRALGRLQSRAQQAEQLQQRLVRLQDTAEQLQSRLAGLDRRR